MFHLAARFVCEKLDNLMNNAGGCYYFAKSKRKKAAAELDL